jgi:hypothetical protein
VTNIGARGLAQAAFRLSEAAIQTKYSRPGPSLLRMIIPKIHSLIFRIQSSADKAILACCVTLRPVLQITSFVL